jgi:imidazolonepropionase-like amidohydrolase
MRFCFGAGLSILAVFSAAVGAPANDIVIENVTLISPERTAPLPHANVVIRDGRIVAVGQKAGAGASANRIDGTGRYLIPGLIDSHVHVGHSAALDDDAIDAHPELWSAYKAQVPRAYLAFGFTSIVDLDSTAAQRKWFSSTPLHPRFYYCGGGIKVAGGYTAFKVPPLSSPAFPNLVYESAEAKSWPRGLDPADFTPARAVERAHASGAICVKAFVESGYGIFHWPYLHTVTLRQVRQAAAMRHLPLVVHATGTDGWREALDARAAIVAHGLWVWPGDRANPQPSPEARAEIAEAARRNMFVQPTLQVVAGERAFLETKLLDDARLGFALPHSVIGYLRSPEGEKARLALLDEYRKASPAPGFEPLLTAAIERTHETFRLMLHDHVHVLLGSDTPAGDGFGNPPGLNGRLEMQDWADAGAPLSLILRAATHDNAKALGLAKELGTIEPGKRADMLLLRENPLQSVSAYDSIETVFLDGQSIARQSLRSAQ